MMWNIAEKELSNQKCEKKRKGERETEAMIRTIFLGLFFPFSLVDMNFSRAENIGQSRWNSAHREGVLLG